MQSRLRWVVRKGEGDRLRDILAHLKVGDDAVRDGRVFIGRRRAGSPDDAVKVGDEVFVSSKEEERAVTLLFDEDGLVAADKPADMGTIPDQEGASGCLIASVARALGVATEALHATSRLDRGVSGVVFFAKNAEAAERLRAAREQGRYERRYVAIATAAPRDPSGEWNEAIGRAGNPRHRAVSGRDATAARSKYEVVGRAGTWALLALEPVTGRTHQLRVHAAHAGAALLGDRVYGGPSRATLASGSVVAFDRIALHAARVSVPRKDGRLVDVVAPIPTQLRTWWKAGGGDDGAWTVITAPRD